MTKKFTIIDVWGADRARLIWSIVDQIMEAAACGRDPQILWDPRDILWTATWREPTELDIAELESHRPRPIWVSVLTADGRYSVQEVFRSLPEWEHVVNLRLQVAHVLQRVLDSAQYAKVVVSTANPLQVPLEDLYNDVRRHERHVAGERRKRAVG